MRTSEICRVCVYAAAAAAIVCSWSASAGAADGPIKLTCRPAAGRDADVGCWLLSSERLGAVSESRLYWHLYAYPSRAAAARAKGPGQTVLESLGRIWLMTIAPKNFRSSTGDRVAVIGPLVVDPGREYTAQYMEAIFPPGFDTPVHRHPGPEAWYTAAGEVCLETPEGKSVGRAGDANGVVVAGGLPMRLSVTGSEQRRSIVLILHDSGQPHTALASDWTPQGLCRR